MRAALDEIAGMVQPGSDARSFPWQALRYEHTQAIRARLAERYAPATANKMLSALRGVLKACWRLGYVSAEEYQRACDIPSVRGTRLPRGRALTQGELRALFEACHQEGGAQGMRDAALLAILYGGGLRRSEVVALDLEDYSPGDGALTVRRGKGNKERIVYLAGGAKRAVEAWLEARGNAPGPLLCPIRKNGTIELRRMTAQAVLLVLQRLACKAHIPAFSPHDLRRSFISHLLDAGADIATVQKLAGHAQVTTTARYDRRGEEAKRGAVELLHVPYI